ncbi:MAG: hypothetical protein NUK65_10780, partial [Firmicutes bacterium]|nr:hypothetical protein [Bacillota bacterium]
NISLAISKRQVSPVLQARINGTENGALSCTDNEIFRLQLASDKCHQYCKRALMELKMARFLVLILKYFAYN